MDLSQFCTLWRLPPPAAQLDLFFIDTEGADGGDSDLIAMRALSVLGSIADIRLGVIFGRAQLPDIANLMNGVRTSSLFSSCRLR
jgi:hypothetical protein